MNSSIQQFQMLLGMAIGLAMLGTFIFSLAGRWIGGVWTTLVAVPVICPIAYRLVLNVHLFSNLKTDLIQRILAAAIPFTACIILMSVRRIPPWARFLFAVIGPTMFLYWIFSQWSTATLPRVTLLTNDVIPVSIGILVAWLLIEPVASRSPGAAAPLVLGFFLGGVTFILMISSPGSQVGQIAPVLCATIGGAMLAAVVSFFIGQKSLSFARGPVLLWLTLAGGLFAFVWFYTDLPAIYLEMIAVAPLIAWIPEIGPVHRLKPWKRELLRVALLAIPVLIACALAYKQHKREAVESGDDYSFLTGGAAGVEGSGRG
jgi:hypothetical protein